MTEPEINILFNQVTFALPCQNFDIKYSVTKQERLPIVTEFVVRLIYVCECIAVSKIKDYFGFSIKETEVVIQSLKNERLVLFNIDNELELTEYAKSKFADSSDDLPRFFKIEDKSEVISFNLVSFNHLKKLGLNNKFNSLFINLNETDSHSSKSNYYAEKSFVDNFYKITNDKSDEKIELYKISSVFPKNRYSFPVPLNFYIQVNSDSLDIVNSKDTEDLIKNDNGIYKVIIDNFSQNNVFNTRYANQVKYLLDYIKIFKDRVVNNKLNIRNELNLLSYIKEVHIEKIINYNNDTEALLGELYVNDENYVGNFNLIIQKLSKYKEHHKSFCWLAPENDYFGRTSLFKEFIGSIIS